MKFTTSDGIEYMQDEYGIHQLNPVPFQYDSNYCGIYDDPERKAKSDLLQALRLGFIIGAHGKVPETILDYGSGNFAFLDFAKQVIPKCYGYDVADYPVPEGIEKTPFIYKKYDCITMHDALEHVLEPEFIRALNCETLVVSLPNVGNQPNVSTQTKVGTFIAPEMPFREWFDKQYFHRKPNEHLHHYNPTMLQKFIESQGWKLISISKHEDVIRKRGQWNIISAAFKKA